LAARREETSELTEALPRMPHATNQVDGRNYLESTIRKGGQIRGIAHLKFDAASPQRARQNQSARSEPRAWFLHFDHQLMTLRHAPRRLDKGLGIIKPQDVVYHTPQFKGKPANCTAEVKAVGLGARPNRQQVLLAQALMETQQSARDEWKRANLPGPPVVEQQVFVEVAPGFVRVEPHNATCFTNSVGW
jgi:hypothetical protein